MATIIGSFAKTITINYLIKDAGHDRLSCLKECALIQERNSPFHMNDVPPTLKISHRIFRIPSAAAEFVFNTDSYVHRLHSSKTAERDRWKVRRWRVQHPPTGGLESRLHKWRKQEVIYTNIFYSGTGAVLLWLTLFEGRPSSSISTRDLFEPWRNVLLGLSYTSRTFKSRCLTPRPPS